MIIKNCVSVHDVGRRPWLDRSKDFAKSSPQVTSGGTAQSTNTPDYVGESLLVIKHTSTDHSFPSTAHDQEMSANEEALTNDAFAQRMLNYVAKDPSPRNPRISRDNNLADVLEAQMQVDGHRTWGYVIYRSTYASDSDWEEFMRRIRWWTEFHLDFYGGLDVLDWITWTVFDDQSQFDGATTAMIRQHFKQWTQSAIRTEQRTSNSDAPVTMGRSPRYRYCIQVDSEALTSVLQSLAPPAMDNGDDAWVKLISKDWLPVRENPAYARPGIRIDDTVYEPIEGVTEEHVGWVKCPFSAVTVEFYVAFQDLNGYTVAERRPPALIG